MTQAQCLAQPVPMNITVAVVMPMALTTLSRTLEKISSPLGDISSGTATPPLMMQIIHIF